MHTIVAATGAADEPASSLVIQRDGKFFLRSTVHQERELDTQDMDAEKFVNFLLAKWGYSPVLADEGSDLNVEDEDFAALFFDQEAGAYRLRGTVPYETDGLLPLPDVVKAS